MSTEGADRPVIVRVEADDGTIYRYQIAREEADRRDDSLMGRARRYIDGRDWNDGEAGYDLVVELAAALVSTQTALLEAHQVQVYGHTFSQSWPITNRASKARAGSFTAVCACLWSGNNRVDYDNAVADGEAHRASLVRAVAVSTTEEDQ